MFASTPKSFSLSLMIFSVAAAIVLLASPALADSDSAATVAVSSRLSYQNSGEGDFQGDNYTLHLGMRAEFLYFLGAEFEVATMRQSDQSDYFRPDLRLTGHLHLINNESFDLYLGIGLAADNGADLLNASGATTLYRLGGGAEYIFDRHWALGVDLYWNLPGRGYVDRDIDAERQDLEANGSLEDAQALLDQGYDYDTSNFELGLAVRYFF